MSSLRPERISISEEISSPAIDVAEHRVAGRRVPQALERRDEQQRLGIDEGELLLDARP